MAANQATDEDVGPAINVITWFITVTAILAFIARVATKRVMSRLAMDDGLMLLALVASIAIAGITTVQTANGLGQHIDTLAEGQLQKLQKTSYANGLLYVFVVVFSKFSVLRFLSGLTPVTRHQFTVKVLAYIVALWGISGFFVAAFLCTAPEVWTVFELSRCINLTAFWDYQNISNICLELTITVFPVLIVVGLKANISGKLLVIFCFLTRIMVVAALIAEVTLREKHTPTTDPTFTSWSTVLSSRFVQSLSITTACIVYLKPFLASLQTGMIRTDDLRRRAGNAKGHYTISAPGGLRIDSKDSQPGSKSSERSSNTRRAGLSLPLENLKKKDPTRVNMEPKSPGYQWDAQSHASTRMMINVVTEDNV